MIRRSVPGLIAALMLLMTAACAGDGDAEPQISSSPKPITTMNAPDPRIAGLKTDDPTARETYAFAAQVALRYQFNGEYLRLALGDMVDADFNQFEGVLTASALKTLRTAVGGAASFEDDANTVRALTFVDFTSALANSGLSLRDDPQIVINQKITKPRYKFQLGYPTIWLTSTGDVLVQGEAGQTAVAYAVRMKLEIHETKKGLRIHAWDATWAFNGDKPAAIA
ncbi:MAG: hypothetical protein WB508_00025 [Aeromicrobium sp.]|uniref:hypothetical protein n=1 Tax=Aeromicrobium sp. TaxID=1871063 RepID=UPI003C6B04E3